jgi:hypothetical protein
MEPASANPKSEWSVKTVFRPIVFAWRMASWPRAEREAWAWTMDIRSRITMLRKMGKKEKIVGSVASLCSPGKSISIG